MPDGVDQMFADREKAAGRRKRVPPAPRHPRAGAGADAHTGAGASARTGARTDAGTGVSELTSVPDGAEQPPQQATGAPNEIGTTEGPAAGTNSAPDAAEPVAAGAAGETGSVTATTEEQASALKTVSDAALAWAATCRKAATRAEHLDRLVADALALGVPATALRGLLDQMTARSTGVPLPETIRGRLDRNEQ